MKKCPYCAEKIQLEAKKCKHCGEWLKPRGKVKAIIVSILVLLFGGFGFFLYSWKKALVVITLFFLPWLYLNGLDTPSANWILLTINIVLAFVAYHDVRRNIELLINSISTFIGITIIPIIILNWVAVLIGGIWLLILGEWGLLIFGLIVSLIYPYIYSVAIIVQLPFMGLLNYFSRKKKKKSMLIAAFFSILIGHIIILTYVFSVFDQILTSGLDTNNNILPYLLLGYAIVVSPLSYMASKESDDNIASFIGVYVAQMTYIILAIFYLVGLEDLIFPVVIMLVFSSELFLLKAGSELYDSEYSIKN